MKKIMFDTSIHLGQFCTTDEVVRMACKNSQIAISTKPATEINGVVSFNENSWSDHIVWSLAREEQDVFYKFMDVFHTVKNIERVPLSAESARLALNLVNELDLEISNALTCAVAVLEKSAEIQTLYDNLLQDKVITYIKNNYNITIAKPVGEKEMFYTETGLDGFYQDTLRLYRERNLNLLQKFHA